MPAPFEQYESIKTLTPVAPLGGVITVGTRDDRGVPVKKDRFFIKEPDLVKIQFKSSKGKEFSADGRELHPDFEPWNSRAEKGRYIKHSRTGVVLVDLSVVRGFVAKPSVEGAFKSKYWAPELPGLKAPGRYPACTGNGEFASRFTGKMNGNKPCYEKGIPCAGEDCPFRQEPEDGSPTPCAPKATLMFYPTWVFDGRDLAEQTEAGRQAVADFLAMPTPPMMWSTRSPQSAENALGMLEMARDVGRGLGIADPSLLGLPFEMRITHPTSSVAKRTFPIERFRILTDIPAWFKAQKAQQQKLGAGGFVSARRLELRDPDEYLEEMLLLEAGDQTDLRGPIGEDSDDDLDPFAADVLPPSASVDELPPAAVGGLRVPLEGGAS